MTNALYAGSFDPFTRGHLDIVRRAADIFGSVTIGVADNPAKKYTFTREERKALIRETLKAQLGGNIADVVSVDGLTIDYAKVNGFTHLVKGARTSQDFDYERLLNDISLTQQLGVDTILMFSDPKLSSVSSSAAKELARHQGLIHEFVPLNVKAALERKNGQNIIGVTGTIGAGKSTLARNLARAFSGHHINLDEIAHQLVEAKTPLAKATREKIQNEFGTSDRKDLGKIVFNDPAALTKLNEIYREPLLTMLRLELQTKKGVIFLEGALLAELGWLHLCNNRVILVEEPRNKEQHIERLMKRGLNPAQIGTRLQSQYTTAKKADVIGAAIAEEGFGILITHESEDLLTAEKTQKTMDAVRQILMQP